MDKDVFNVYKRGKIKDLAQFFKAVFEMPSLSIVDIASTEVVRANLDMKTALRVNRV